jgi:transcriptional regulator with XRE-family HTH domain
MPNGYASRSTYVGVATARSWSNISGARYRREVGILPAGEVHAEPAVNELWLLDWDSKGLLAAVLTADDARLVIAPVTAEAPEEADDAVVVPASSSPASVELHIWGGLRREVPLGVFLRPAGRVSTEAISQARSMPAPGTRSWAAGMQRAELVAAVDTLSHASWIPDVTEAVAAVRLADLMRDRRLRPAALAEVSGVPVAAITELLREQRRATADEVERLAAALQVEPADVRRPVGVPAALVHAVERPIHRVGIRVRAAAAGVSEAAARVMVAEAVIATPARTTSGERDVETWDQLIRHYLDG